MTSPSESDSDRTGPASINPWLNWRRKRFWLVILLLTYTLAGFFLTPWLIERQLRNTVTETGRSVSLSKIKTNPFLLTLDLQGLEIKDTDSTTLLTLDRLFFNIQTSSVLNLALTFKSLSIEQPRLYGERFAGNDTRWVRFLQDLSAEEAPEAQAKDSKPPPVYLQALNVTDAYLSFRDQTLDGFEATAGPMTVNLANIRTRPDHIGSQNVELLIHDTDRVQWQGELQLVPFQSTGTVQLDANKLPQLRALLDLFIPFDLAFESLSTTFQYQVAIGDEGLTFAASQLAGNVQRLEAVMDSGGDPVVALAEISFRGGSLNYPAQTAGLEHLALSGLTINAALEEDGRLSLLEMIPQQEPSEPRDGNSSTASAAQAWKISLDEFVLDGGALNLADRSISPVVAVTASPIAASASGIDNQPGTRIPLAFQTVLSSGGTIGFEGHAMALPRPEVSGALTLAGVRTALVQPYVNQFLNVGLSGGELSLSADVSHGPDQLLAAAGSLNYDQFELQDLLREERLAAWDTLQVNRFELDADAKSLATSELEFHGLYGRVAIAEDRSTNVGDLLTATPARQPDQAAGTFAVTLGGVIMHDTALDFSDRSLPLPFDAAIREMDGTVSTLSTVSEEASEVAIEGRVNEFGEARINGTTRLLDPANNTDIAMIFRNLDISRLSPYTIQFAGYSIDAGRMDLDLGYRLAQRQLQGDNRVVIREMQLGDKSDLPGAGSLPLGLAVALLTDSEGVIDLAVPVEGDLDNPEFKIGGVVWRAIGNLITKAVTAPFRFLGKLVGIDSEDFGTLSFQPGRADLSPPDQEQLVKLGEAMLQRPELSVEVAGSWAGALDRPAMQDRAVAEAVSQWLDQNPGNGEELTTARDRRALESLILAANPDTSLETLKTPFISVNNDDPDGEPELDEVAYLTGLRERLAAQVEIGEAQLSDLARARGLAVIEGLRAGQPGAQLRVSEVEPVSVEPAEDDTIPLELAVAGAD